MKNLTIATQKKQQELVLIANQQSEKLMQCIAIMNHQGDDDTTRQNRSMAKMEYAAMTSALMPNGNPSYLEVVNYPTIKQLAAKHGNGMMVSALFVMVKNLCESLNFVRNMTEDQMIEAAAMLLDEADNFRLQDYQMMFALAKRGTLVKLMDRLDISIIGLMMDAYYTLRRRAGEKYYEQNEADRVPEIQPETPEELEMQGQFGKLAGIMKAWISEEDEKEEAKLAEKHKKDAETYARMHNVNFEEVLKQGSNWKPEEIKNKPDREHSLNKRK